MQIPLSDVLAILVRLALHQPPLHLHLMPRYQHHQNALFEKWVPVFGRVTYMARKGLLKMLTRDATASGRAY